MMIWNIDVSRHDLQLLHTSLASHLFRREIK